MKMHSGRLNMDSKCRTCGAEPLDACLFGIRSADPRDDDPKALQAWLEFQVFTAIHNLKEVAPNHILVRAVSNAISSPLTGEDLPAMLKRQAD